MESFIVHPKKSQVKALRAFLEALDVPFESKNEDSLPLHVIQGIQKGLADVEAGRTITLSAFKEKLAAKH